MYEVEKKTYERCDADRRVEPNRTLGFLFQTRRPLEHFADGIGRGSRKHGNRKQPGTHNSHGKNEKRKFPGERFQRPGGLVSRPKVPESKKIQCGCRPKDNEERHKV